MSLIIIMGINWIFGILSFNHHLLPLIYLFGITTALQVSKDNSYCMAN